ncbi:MAG: HEAT repeat domain-containing protein [Cyanobacteria bacterium P01_H01_bin.121]
MTFTAPVPESLSRPSVVASPQLNRALTELEQGDFQARWDASKIISRFGEAAIHPLLELLDTVDLDDDADWELAWFVARSLGRLKHEAAIQPLVQLMQMAQTSAVAEIAAAGLAELDDVAIPYLEPLLQHPTQRKYAVQALAKMRSPRIVDRLLILMTDPDIEIRVLAVEALSGFSDSRIAPAFLSALSDRHARVRQVAAVGVGRRYQDQALPSPGTVQRSPERDGALSDVVVDVAVDVAVEAAVHNDAVTIAQVIEALRPLLDDLQLTVAQEAARAMGQIGSNLGLPALQACLTPRFPVPLQVTVCQAIAHLASREALLTLQEILESPQTPAQLLETIVIALADVRHGSSQELATEILVGWVQLQSVSKLRQWPRTLRQQIALSLGHTGSLTAYEPLLKLLADPNQSIQLHAIAGLRSLNIFAVQDTLQAELNARMSNSELCQGIQFALTELANSSQNT